MHRKGFPVLPMLFFLIGFLVFSPSLSYDFLFGSDDDAYIFQNPHIKTLSVKSIFENLFSFQVFYSYIPLTKISYSIDFSML
jgi:hypothetical protein